MFDEQFNRLKVRIKAKSPKSEVTRTDLGNGGVLITVTEVNIGKGWNRETATVLFVAPPGYPSAAPDCFWVEPAGLRLEGGATPNASNDGNPIPGDGMPGRFTTWFSWHVQAWNPNSDTLLGYYQRILDRLLPAR